MSTGSTVGKVLLIILGVIMLLGGACSALVVLSVNNGNAQAVGGGVAFAAVAVLGIMLIVSTSKRR